MLSGLTRLTVLRLTGTAVTDLSPLYKMSTLERLHLGKTRVDAAQIEAFKKELPGCMLWGVRP